ncbi:MAG TPA: NAD(P)H-dependent oxidoreductase [Parvibaculum sp.]
MKVLLVYAHPVAESFGAAMRDAAMRGLAHAGHEIRLIDLYAENFDPRLSRQERLDYEDETKNTLQVRRHIDDLQWAEALAFVFPTWWYGPPAILKGWFDRAFAPGIAFHLADAGKVIRPALTNIRLLIGITSCGSPWWFAKYVGEPHRRIIMRGIHALCGWRCKTVWMAIFNMDSATLAARSRYLRRIEARMARLR